MKKNCILLIICLIISGCGVTFENEKLDNFSEVFNESNTTISFSEVSVDEIYKKQDSGDTFFLYIGRNSCPYCLEFITKLNAVADTADIKIYYLDSVDAYDNSSDELKEFRDLYLVENVPAFKLFIGKDNVNSLEINSQTTQEDILQFIESSLND